MGYCPGEERTMTAETHFLQSLHENPEDSLLRTVYADWLEERSDPRGELLRAECRLVPLLCANADDRALQDRYSTLRRGCERDWLVVVDRIGLCIPPWWSDVRVSLPVGNSNEEEMRQFVRDHYGADIGHKSGSWRSALKCWAIWELRRREPPVYAGHCFRKGGHLESAAEVHAEAYYRFRAGPEVDWHRCYMAYEVGRTYLELGDRARARDWLARAACYVDHLVGAIAYYANESRELLEQAG
jgi:uncharacterized protein (TIGR02996 family)